MDHLKIFYANHYKGDKIDLAYSRDAGLDLRYAGELNLEMSPGKVYQISTGIHTAIPNGCFGLVLEKSGLGRDFGTICHGRVIDAGYRGEIIILMSVLVNKIFSPGDKVAQLVITPHIDSILVAFGKGMKLAYEEVFNQCDLGETERGDKGFGSSGT